ncbi:MAG TPA: efflux RND transporter periplasmic adaptor subunit [Spirochaetia bacterium]|nr:efflux RND transporter periplasmic adaptor subunit [Spirochaetaceae bacterium]HPE89293.1 efflux RND transporter periplasmic adaptor subunit [Spirochaetales bacterium]HRW24420.1 efflux RND transporter periplasmic adaptor subunit [Spirochaetia bacterium]
MKRKRALIIASALAAATLVAAILLVSGKSHDAGGAVGGYEYATISRGSIESVVSSSGTLSVVSSVSVLAQMSGRLETVEVDFNDDVVKGQVLATINTDILRLQAKAAQAAVDKARANYDLQVLDRRNAESLYAKGLLSEYDLMTSRSTLDVRAAELASAEASLEEIVTEIEQYAIITSPIDGIVLERAVDRGQSVVGSSSSSTSLFTIAEDLERMQIEAEVDELDIGSIEAGQAVRFTVEAEPGSVFSGRVKEIRLVPESSDNVVYYTVVILADNESGRLLPGMTASVTFIKEKKDDVLVVPNSALRFTPTGLTEAEIARAKYAAGLGSMGAEEKAAALARYDESAAKPASEPSSGSSSGLAGLMGGSVPGGRMGGPMGGPGAGAPPSGSSRTGSAGASGSSGSSAAAKETKTLWYVDESGALTALLVEVGASDGSVTELIGAEALEGVRVVSKLRVE